MAYMSQEMKKKMAPGIKAVLKKYGVKGSISVRHYSTIVVTLTEGSLDLKEHPNIFWLKRDYEGQILSFYEELREAMSIDYYNRSDSMSDYYDVSYYRAIKVGGKNPYKHKKV